MPPVVKSALLLDAEMTVQAAARRLAQHGFWRDPEEPFARAWLQEYVARISESISRARTTPAQLASGRAPASTADATAGVPTLAEAARLLARPVTGQWAIIRRQDGVTLFWYAFRISDLLPGLSGAAPERTVREVLDLHEDMATPTATVEAENVPTSGPELQVVLNGLAAVGVKEPDERAGHWSFDYFDDTFRGSVTPPGTGTADAAGAVGVTTGGFPFLEAPQKVAVGIAFDLEIGLSDAPVAGVAIDGAAHAPRPRRHDDDPGRGASHRRRFSAPAGWRRTLDVAVADPTKARVGVPLVALAQAEPVRLTSLAVQFVVGGVARGAAARNIVVERAPGLAPPPDERGLSWVDATAAPAADNAWSAPFVPDIELDIAKPDGNATRGHYRCVMRNAHGVPVPDEAVNIDLGDDAGTFAKGLIDQIRQHSGKPIVALLLDGVAAQIAGKLPGEFWDMLRGVAAKVTNRPITLQLNSAEPYVPWELALVDPPIDPARPSFLGAQVVMGRWIQGDRNCASPPRHALAFRAMAVMAGMYNAAAGLRSPAAGDRGGESPDPGVCRYASDPARLHRGQSADAARRARSTSISTRSAASNVCISPAMARSTRPGPAMRRSISTMANRSRPCSSVTACWERSTARSCFSTRAWSGRRGVAGRLRRLSRAIAWPGGFCGLVAPLWAVNDSVAKSFAIEFYRKRFPPERTAAACPKFSAGCVRSTPAKPCLVLSGICLLRQSVSEAQRDRDPGALRPAPRSGADGGSRWRN